jgi:two-component system invasion response regulator UvrY
VNAVRVNTEKLRVLLVDDQRAFRIAARSVLESGEGYVVVGEAADGEQAVELVDSLRPQVILMDVRLPGISGIEATRQILEQHPAAVVVLLSTHGVSDLPPDLLHCGAVGFLRKEMLDPIALARLLDGAAD